MEITITKRTQLKPKPDENNLVFGTEFTDHMFIMDYTEGKGWHDARIVPYGPIELSPAAMVLHYAQEVFEGMKAYKTPEGDIQFFRPMENFARMNRSNVRMCIPQIDEETLMVILADEFPDARQDMLKQFAGIFLDLQEKAMNSEISTKSVDLRGIMGSLRTIRRGLRPMLAINMGVIGKTFDQYEKEIVYDVIRTRIREDWTAEDIF